MARKLQGIASTKARAQLGLTQWQYQIAVRDGLLARLDDGSVEPASLEAALTDPTWQTRLEGSFDLNLTQGAARLKVSTDRLRRVIAATGLEASKEEPWKFGWVTYWRARDLDSLVGALALDAAERAVKAAAKRPEAAAKAKETRARNLARVAEAEASVAALVRSCASNPLYADGAYLPQDVVTLGGMLSQSSDNPRYRRFDRDPKVMAAKAHWALVPAAKQAKLLEELEECGGIEAVKAAMDADWSTEQEVHTLARPVSAQQIYKRVPSRAGCIPWATLDTFTENPPTWLQEAWAVAESERALIEAHQRLENERIESHWKRVQELRELGTLRAPAVAELLGAPVEVVRAAGNKRDTWSPEYVAERLAHPPAWARDEAAQEALLAKVAREREAAVAKREARARKHAKRDAQWVRGWSRALGVPEEVVLARGNPTKEAVAAVERNPPRWLREYREAAASTGDEPGNSGPDAL